MPGPLGTPVLDDFNRADENPVSQGGNWIGKALSAHNDMEVASNQLKSASGTGSAIYDLTITDGEVFASVPTASGGVFLYARTADEGGAGLNGYRLDAADILGGIIQLMRLDPGQATFLANTDIGQGFTSGDDIALVCEGDSIQAWHRPDGGEWTKVLDETDATYASGRIGAGADNTTARLDDFGGDEPTPPPERRPSVIGVVRELSTPPLSVMIEPGEGGEPTRWGEDEVRPTHAIDDVTFSSQNPGGEQDCSVKLARRLTDDVADAEPGNRLTVIGPGRQVVWGPGIIRDRPRSSEDVDVRAVGMAEVLNFRPGAFLPYVDRDLNRWQGPSSQRRLNLLGSSVDPLDPSVDGDLATGRPALRHVIRRPIARSNRVEAWYLTGNPLGEIYVNPAGVIFSLALFASDSNWSWFIRAADDDVDTNGTTRVGGSSATPSAGYTALANRKCVLIYIQRTGADSSEEGQECGLLWRDVAVYGNHGLTRHGPDDPQGILGSDAIAHTLNELAPQLDHEVGDAGTIAPSDDFPIPHLVRDAGMTARQFVELVDSFHLRPWGVFGKRFFWRPWELGRVWVLHREQAQFQASGDTVADSIAEDYNGALVTFSDPSGTQQVAGPPGSGADHQFSGLEITDEFGSRINRKRLGPKWVPLQAHSPATPAGAFRRGKLFLDSLTNRPTRGTGTVVGPIQDEAGQYGFPFDIRPGDRVRFADEPGGRLRNVTNVSYSSRSQTAQVELDGPEDRVETTVNRLQVRLEAAGF